MVWRKVDRLTGRWPIIENLSKDAARMPRNGIPLDDFCALQAAALDRSPVKGLTHNFYRYPARFSPSFAAAAIERFSSRGDVVLDPYMGGGTTVVEAMRRGRKAIGNDLNELSGFVVKAKTTRLTTQERKQVVTWLNRATEEMQFRNPKERIEHLFDDNKTHNLSLPSARPIKKALAQGLHAAEGITSQAVETFARCALLRLGQWALDGRKTTPSLSEFRSRLPIIVAEMFAGLDEFELSLANLDRFYAPVILSGDAAKLHENSQLCKQTAKADLVVTSPPYPGVHMLYHRWQINGRREAPAPYWVSGCDDGHGAAYYNFADRRAGALAKYFEVSLLTLKSLRQVVKEGALVVQMVAFSEPDTQLSLYLANMIKAGFREVDVSASPNARIWRDVPGRKWHANLQGRTNSAREVVLVHRAV